MGIEWVGGRVTVVVRGMPVRCWKCRRPSRAVVALHRVDQMELEWAAWHSDPPVLAMARRLLAAGGEHGLASQIAVRRSSTARGSYLSNGCHHCSALFGAFFLEEDVTARASSGAETMAEFDELATGVVPSDHWAELLDARTTLIG